MQGLRSVILKPPWEAIQGSFASKSPLNSSTDTFHTVQNFVSFSKMISSKSDNSSGWMRERNKCPVLSDLPPNDLLTSFVQFVLIEFERPFECLSLLKMIRTPWFIRFSYPCLILNTLTQSGSWKRSNQNCSPESENWSERLEHSESIKMALIWTGLCRWASCWCVPSTWKRLVLLIMSLELSTAFNAYVTWFKSVYILAAG